MTLSSLSKFLGDEDESPEQRVLGPVRSLTPRQVINVLVALKGTYFKPLEPVNVTLLETGSLQI